MALVQLAPLADLDAEGLEELARLHMVTMPTLLTDLGYPFVLEYYRVAQSDPSAIGVFAYSVGRKVVGWAVGCPDPAALNSRLKRNPVWFARQVLLLAARSPAVVWQLIVSALFAANTMERGHAIELTYIGVTNEMRGRGVGSALLSRFIAMCRAAGHRAVVLSVEKVNTEAVDLYTRFGFVLRRTFKEGRFERVRMELALSADEDLA